MNQKVKKIIIHLPSPLSTKFNFFFPLPTESCVKTHCQDGLEVYFATDTQEYTYAPIYGYYNVQPNDVYGRPSFKITMGKEVGLWWDDPTNRWIFGLVGSEGDGVGVGYNPLDVFCPHEFSEDCHHDGNCYEGANWLRWGLLEGSDWILANRSVGITCK